MTMTVREAHPLSADEVLEWAADFLRGLLPAYVEAALNGEATPGPDLAEWRGRFREAGWRAWAGGGTASMRQILAEQTKHSPALWRIVSRAWDQIGGPGDWWEPERQPWPDPVVPLRRAQGAD